mgnify:CR=1 FL=1
MKKMPMNILLPEDIARDLRSYIAKRQISKFIAQAVEEKLFKKKEQLAKDLITSSSDNIRKKEGEEWDQLLIEDGLNDENQY